MFMISRIMKLTNWEIAVAIAALELGVIGRVRALVDVVLDGLLFNRFRQRGKAGRGANQGKDQYDAQKSMQQNQTPLIS